MPVKLFERILVTTDGSEKNKAAVEEGIRIARTCGSQLFAVYVIDSGTYEQAPVEVAMGDTYRQLRDEAERSLEQVRSLAGGIPLETVILEGKPAAEIVRFAEEKEVDLIIIGTRGKRGLERIFLGSVAEAVVRTAACRVLVVK
ncbi:MAG TPA: universal stress protein [Methanoregula sp.]|nr:universal stress protein [Methanoregula sp.]